VAKFFFEGPELVELYKPSERLRVPYEADRLQVLDATRRHWSGWIVRSKFLVLISLSLDPIGQNSIPMMGVRDRAVPMFDLVIGELLKLRSPRTFLIRPLLIAAYLLGIGRDVRHNPL